MEKKTERRLERFMRAPSKMIVIVMTTMTKKSINSGRTVFYGKSWDLSLLQNKTHTLKQISKRVRDQEIFFLIVY